MQEEEWLACTDPDRMLSLLGSRASKRKLRLFAVACCRQIARWIKPRACLQAVDMSELFADGLVDAGQLQKTQRQASDEASLLNYDALLLMKMSRYAQRDAAIAAAEVARKRLEPAQIASLARSVIGFTSERPQDQCALLRDMFGGLFHPIALAPSLLAWKESTIVRLAQAAYDHRQTPVGSLDGKILGVLSDALEEAGCDSTDLLSHLRGSGPHFRGCWAVDLLLAKK